MTKNIPFDIEYEAENEYPLDMLITVTVEDQNHIGLNRILREYVEENQTTDRLNGLSVCLRNAIKALYPNTNVEDVYYCEDSWDGPDMFLFESFSMAYSASRSQVILSSSNKSVLVSESDNSTITSVGEGCFVFVLGSDCTVTVKGDNCFVYVAGDNNLVNIVGNNSSVIFSGKDNTLIIKGNSKFKGLSGSDIIFINDEESQYEVGKIHSPKFVKDLKFETWYRFGHENGSFIEVPPGQISH